MTDDLLLAEELLLLSLDDEKGSDFTWSGLDPGLAGALLIELTEMGALRVDGEGNLVAGGPRPGDALLAEALDVVTSSDRPRGAKHWVDRLPGKLKPLRRRIAERLVDRGILGEERREVLGMTMSHRYPERDSGPEQALRDRLMNALIGDGEPGPRDAELICLRARSSSSPRTSRASTARRPGAARRRSPRPDRPAAPCATRSWRCRRRSS
jgi:hypothetical protein